MAGGAGGGSVLRVSRGEQLAPFKESVRARQPGVLPDRGFAVEHELDPKGRGRFVEAAIGGEARRQQRCEIEKGAGET
jgi:hypothetical protein